MYVANIPEEFKIILTDPPSGQGRLRREAALGRGRSAELRPAAESESEIRALKRETAAAEVQLSSLIQVNLSLFLFLLHRFSKKSWHIICKFALTNVYQISLKH